MRVWGGGGPGGLVHVGVGVYGGGMCVNITIDVFRLLFSPLAPQVAVEFHKRFDPIYADAHQRIRNLGSFSHFSSYMAQPKQQLDTFRQWAGLSSDISYYVSTRTRGSIVMGST